MSRYLTFTFTKSNENGPFGKPGTETAGTINILLLNYGGQFGFTQYIAQLLPPPPQKKPQNNPTITKKQPKNKQTFHFVLLDKKINKTICVRGILLHTLVFSAVVCTLLTVSKIRS